jgi:hypothetical protein
MALASVLLGLSSCRGGCQGRGARDRPLDVALALVPAEARVVVFVDFARIRDTPTWTKLVEITGRNPEDKKRIDELTLATGLDPLRQLTSLLIAFPEDARKLGEFGLVLRSEGFDEKRLVAYARDEVLKRGGDIVGGARDRRTLWSDTRDPATAGFFADYQTFVLGGGGWAERMADLADGVPGTSSAESRADLVALCQRAGARRPAWAAAVVPAETRRRLIADPRFDSAASVTRMAAGIELGTGLTLELAADLSNAADATAIAGKVKEAVREAKRSPQVLMMGIASYLDGVMVKSEGPSLIARLELTDRQVDDLLGRLAGFLHYAATRSPK